MKISDIYLKKLEDAKPFLAKARNTQDYGARDSFESRALGYQCQAGHLAHCIARFGDQHIETMDIPKLLAQVENMNCAYENPWLRGLRVIERELAS